ncbi:hypothetical protein OC845_001624 [Tilletia horrida]|nr:hypothetical protein OC845_001624 [Tilletia horrida]
MHALLLFVFFFASSSRAATAASAPAPSLSAAALPTTKNFRSLSYRTFSSSDAQAAQFNVSTSTMANGGNGVYGWNFVWRGEAYDPSRPLLLWFGSSSSRCNDVSDTGCILNQGLLEGWPKRIAHHSAYANALLDDANFGVLNIVSPLCYNTTLGTPLDNNCGTSRDFHALKHFRPDLVLGIIRQVQQNFGFDSSKIVGSGASMGGRGIFRVGTALPLRAVSVTGAHLETYTSKYMQALPYVPWDSGEGCWTLGVPNVNASQCTNRVPETMSAASKFASTPVQIYSSYGDEIANLTQIVKPTCDAINQAAGRQSALKRGKSKSSRGLDAQSPVAPRAAAAAGCTVKVQTTPANTPLGPSHNALMGWGYSAADLNFLISGYGGKPVVFNWSS